MKVNFLKAKKISNYRKGKEKTRKGIHKLKTVT